jgi:diguanylate cyclase (GGDEF)-like protein
LARHTALGGALPEQIRPRILLIGNPAARPEGLERLLVGGGFQVREAERAPGSGDRPDEPAPDLLILAPEGRGRLADEVRELVTTPHFGGAPVFVLVATGGPEAVTEALVAGALDAVQASTYPGELRARIDSLIRVRAELSDARDALRSRDLLFDIFQDVSSALRTDEIFQTLVRRVGQAFRLTHCSFVITSPGEDKGRVVAVYENPAIRDLRVELGNYPEILEAIRTARPVVVQDVHEHPLFDAIRKHWVSRQLEVNVQSAVALPVFVQGRAAGVFFLRTERGDPQLRSQDVSFANTIAQAAARVLENEERRSAIYRRQIGAGTTDTLTGCASLDALDRRVRDEFARARRYSLHFSFVLLDIDRLREVNERLGQETGDRVLAELGTLLQREIRAPDFVARYGGDEFALLLPETDARGARLFIERLRQLASRHTFPGLGGQRAPQLAAGVAAYPHAEALRPEDLFTLAEGALAKGKAAAPDRIGVAEGA